MRDENDMRPVSDLRLFTATLGLVFAASCSAAQPVTSLPAAESLQRLALHLKTPAVVAYDSQTDRLEYWPMSPNGGKGSHYISPALGLNNATGIVASGDVVTIAAYSPAELLSYDVNTGATSSIADPLGSPLDVAIDSENNLYALHMNSVGVFRPGSSSSPRELSCSYMTQAEAIAVDNEGDIFVNGYGPGSFIGVIEYPAGSSNCVKVALKRQEHPYLTGIGVDPKTDDLIVENNEACAGGQEGEITIYSQPYGPKVVAQHNLHGNCPGHFRLNATSTALFFPDGPPELAPDKRDTICAANACIDQRSYPKATDRSVYVGGLPTLVTTIPNALPN